MGPLWLANWRPDIADNPQVTTVIGNSCLQTQNGENLAPSLRYRMSFKEYIVCRVLDEERPVAPRAYDIFQARPSVIGLLWAERNQQPLDIPHERCIAEIRIGAIEVATQNDRFMACIVVMGKNPQQIAVHTFELSANVIVEIGGESESWLRRGKLRD